MRILFSLTMGLTVQGLEGILKLSGSYTLETAVDTGIGTDTEEER